MASGDLIDRFGPLDASFPLTSPAQLAVRNNHSYLAYDAAAAETAYFDNLIWPPQFPAANGCTVKIFGNFATATANTAAIQVAFERIGTTQDVDSDGFATAKEVNVTANATSGVHSTATIAFTQAEMDSIADGELYRISVLRDATDATNDTATGDFYLAAIVLLVT